MKTKLSRTALLIFAFLSISGMKAQTIVWSEDFESNWLKNWYVDNGVWEIGQPSSGPMSSHQGLNCAATVLNGNYPNNAETRLIRSASFTVPPVVEEPRLRFWHWFSFDEFEGADYGVIQVKLEDSPTWIDVSNIYRKTGSDVWTYTSVDLSAFAGRNIQVAFYFYATDIFSHSGWYIDEIALMTGQAHINNPESWEHGIGDWSVDMGAWEIGTPTYGLFSAHHGSQCAGTVLNGNYAWDVSSRLISPVFTVPDSSQNPNLGFWHWFSFDDFTGADYGVIQIKPVDSAYWENISIPYNTSSGGIWIHHEVDLTDFAGQRVQVAFYMYATDIFCHPGWYIDDIKINGIPSNGTDFLSFNLPGQNSEPIIDCADHTIECEVFYGTDVSEIISTFTLDDAAIASLNGVQQVSGITKNNFTDPLIYLITADNGMEQEWTIFVTIAANTEAEFLSFNIPNQIGNTIINPFTNTITVKVPNETDLSHLIASFTLSDNAVTRINDTIQTSGVTLNDFSHPLPYIVTAEDSVTIKYWLVTVEKANSISEHPSKTVFVFPNPTNGTINILLNEQCRNGQMIKVLDCFGRPMRKQTITEKETQISLSDQPPGIYFLQLDDGLLLRVIKE